jgi:hypothetical protein
MVIAIAANRLDADIDAHKRSSGTGGFALIGETALPVFHDLNTSDGRDFFGLNAADLQGVSVVPFRVRDGDDASCLNLNRAQQPRLLGVNSDRIGRLTPFTFTQIAEDVAGNNKAGEWSLLGLTSLGAEVPAIGDANSIKWALGKKVGDTLDYVDEQGRPFKIRIVAAVANSILQGSLIIDESAFVQRFPGEGGYRMFLIDAPSNSVSEVSATLSRALQDVGLELTPAAKRLAQFNAVQNTYLNTFQVLGGLGPVDWDCGTRGGRAAQCVGASRRVRPAARAGLSARPGPADCFERAYGPARDGTLHRYCRGALRSWPVFCFSAGKVCRSSGSL